jgi:hypothetical protein
LRASTTAQRFGTIAAAVAKKVRTPPPPRRPVQAPQRRDKKRRPAQGAAQPAGRNLWPIVAVLAVIAVAGIAAALYFGLRGNGNNNTATPVSTGNTNALNALPGVRKIKAPWPPEYAHLNDRLRPLNLNALSQEALAYHIHQHLDVYLNGKPITVPALIGINDGAYLTELHTHDASGIIHVESESSDKHYTLGTFFAEWGIFLSSKCVGAYCQGYTWYINGKKQTGHPWNLVLQPHQVIVIAIGKPPKKIRSTYAWGGL